MNSYRSDYQSYYKNINNAVKGKKDNSKYSIMGKKTDKLISSRYGVNVKGKDNIKNIIIKRIISELIGAISLLLIFSFLNYTPVESIQYIHNECKKRLEENFNLDQYTTTLKSMQIENMKIENLQIDELKTNIYKLMEQLKSDNGATV